MPAEGGGLARSSAGERGERGMVEAERTLCECWRGLS